MKCTASLVKILAFAAVLFLASGAVAARGSSTGEWSARVEIDYLNRLIESGDFFRTDKTFMRMLETLTSEEYINETVTSDDFFIFVQTSLDNGIFRAFFAVKCGDKLCLRLRIGNRADSGELQTEIPINGLYCPYANEYGARNKSNGIPLYPGNMSNYIVCRDERGIRRFGLTGGSPFDIDSLDDVDTRLNMNFPDLFRVR